MVEMICHCGMPYSARQADLDRGWALSCSKSCAAKRRDFNRPKAKRVDGVKVKRKKPKPSSARARDLERNAERDHDYASAAMEDGWDGHKNAI